MLTVNTEHQCSFAAANPLSARPAVATDNRNDRCRPMDSDKERDFAYQHPMSDEDMEEDIRILHRGKGQLQTFWCIQWECELYSRRRPKARCYQFNLKNHRFREKNWQVLHMFDIVHDIIYDII